MAKQCDLRRLAAETPAFTTESCDSWVEAVAVSMDHVGHTHPLTITVNLIAATGNISEIQDFLLPDLTDQMKNVWGDIDEAVEWGAIALALYLTPKITGHQVLQRSSKGPGFDYWLGDRSELPFKNKARLEVSGMLRGTESDVAYRIAAKMKQTHRSEATGLPAIIAVTEFGSPQTCIRTL